MSEREELERDPLPEELRQLYGRLQPPPLADDASEADPETARVVQWMREAWSGLEVPPARVPLVPPRVTTRAPRRLRYVLAAAAAVLLVAGAALWRSLLGNPPTSPAPRVASGHAGANDVGVEILAVRPDHVELRSGPVRLVLLGPPPSDSTPDSGI